MRHCLGSCKAMPLCHTQLAQTLSQVYSWTVPSGIIAPWSFALSWLCPKCVPVRSAPLRLALSRLACLKSAPRKSAKVRFAALRFTPHRDAQHRSALLKFTPLRFPRKRPSIRFTPDRLAPLRFVRQSQITFLRLALDRSAAVKLALARFA